MAKKGVWVVNFLYDDKFGLRSGRKLVEGANLQDAKRSLGKSHENFKFIRAKRLDLKYNRMNREFNRKK